MVRTLGGITAGMAGALVIIMVSEAIGDQFARIPTGIEIGALTDPAPPPLLTLIVPVLGWFLGATLGAWLAIRISGRRGTAWAVAAAAVAAISLKLVLFYYPPWIIAAGLVAPLLGAWLARRYAGTNRRFGRPAPSPQTPVMDDDGVSG